MGGMVSGTGSGESSRALSSVTSWADRQFLEVRCMVALQQVECLEAVIRTRSFRRAAASLNMSQPAVSGHIARLERELQLTILERSPSGATLTPEGERIIPHLRGFAERTELIRRASEEIHGASAPALVIGGAPRFVYSLLPRALETLNDRFASLSIRMETSGIDEVYRLLRVGEVDLGVLALPTGTAVPDDIVSRTFFDLLPTGVCGAVGHPIIDGADGPIDSADLAGAPLVVVAEGVSVDLNATLFPPATRTAVSYVDQVGIGLRLVRRGSGVMCVSGVTAHLVNPALPWRGLIGAPSFTLRLLTLADRPVTAAAQAFVDLVIIWGEHCQPAFRYDPVTGRMSVDGEMLRTQTELAEAEAQRTIG
ncbi:MAG: LysR family transcriptional regulator [Ilumatobacteraceae bacterium]|nr:LysR family transcriptional regulator [Ilumatobacteraceae bacterium]